jgi:mitochondrial fission protein ELM1
VELIHLFTNSDAILNHDALWVIQGKNPNSKAFNVVLRHNMIIFFINTFLRTMRQCKYILHAHFVEIISIFRPNKDLNYRFYPDFFIFPSFCVFS